MLITKLTICSTLFIGVTLIWHIEPHNKPSTYDTQILHSAKITVVTNLCMVNGWMQSGGINKLDRLQVFSLVATHLYLTMINHNHSTGIHVHTISSIPIYANHNLLNHVVHLLLYLSSAGIFRYECARS